MKTSAILAVATGAALAAAQLDQIPTCALTCAITSIGSSGCGQTDIACICQASSFLTGILSCIQGTCNDAQIAQTLKAAQVLCAQAGVTITVPGGSEPTTTTAAPEPEPTTTEETTTEAPAETTTEAPVETTTEAPAETTTEAPAETTTEVPPTYDTTSDVVTLTTTTTICPSSTHEVPTYVPPPAQNTTVAVPPPAYTGAAGNIAANAGTVLIGAALAMFFA